MRSKINILLLVVLFSTMANFAVAQCPLTLSDLEKLCTYKAEEFEKHILKKGYNVNEGLPHAGPQTKICYCRKFTSQKLRDKVDRGVDPSNTPVVTYTTADKAHYETIKADLIKKKYTFVQEFPFHVEGINTKQYVYTEKKHAASMITYTDKDQIPRYAIMIHK